ncbi:MAG: hypothetical protein ACK41P_02305 [Asticcacaulis sp.]
MDLSPYYKGTVLIQQPNGTTDRMHIKPDGRYVIYGTAIPEAHGRWWIAEDGRFCLQADPAPGVAEDSFCHSLKAKAYGESWTETFSDFSVTFTLKAGREP